jgi:hypothetical protein
MKDHLEEHSVSFLPNQIILKDTTLPSLYHDIGKRFKVGEGWEEEREVIRGNFPALHLFQTGLY